MGHAGSDPDLCCQCGPTTLDATWIQGNKVLVEYPECELIQFENN